jgi:hypothetical protein
VHLDHIELSVPVGSLTPALVTDLDLLLHDVLGWDGTSSTVNHPVDGPTTTRTYITHVGPRVVLRERAEAMRGGTEDHLGFVVEPAELDRLASRCSELAAADVDVEVRYLDGGRASRVVTGASVFRTFFVRPRLPLWIQFECHEDAPS